MHILMDCYDVPKALCLDDKRLLDVAADAGYCDVIITRYCELTGVDAASVYATAQPGGG
jgi:hypothetical protein